LQRRVHLQRKSNLLKRVHSPEEDALAEKGELTRGGNTC